MMKFIQQNHLIALQEDLQKGNSNESECSDMEWTKDGLKLTKLSEIEDSSDTDYGVDEDNSKQKEMKYQWWKLSNS